MRLLSSLSAVVTAQLLLIIMFDLVFLRYEDNIEDYNRYIKINHILDTPKLEVPQQEEALHPFLLRSAVLLLL